MQPDRSARKVGGTMQSTTPVDLRPLRSPSVGLVVAPLAHWSAVSALRLQPMVRGFDASGGVLSADLLSGLMRGGTNQPISQLARWIVGRSMPLFQFEPGFASLKPGLAPVLAELAGVFDDLELAAWFSTPNGSLGGEAPADVLARDPCAVLAAARLDRFVATGD
jgi:hypothetical protein